MFHPSDVNNESFADAGYGADEYNEDRSKTIYDPIHGSASRDDDDDAQREEMMTAQRDCTSVVDISIIRIG